MQGALLDVGHSQPAKRMPGAGSRNGRGLLTFLGSLRGGGDLVASGRETAVTYQIDLFKSGAGTIGSGTLDGPLDAIEAAGGDRLRLSDGAEVAVDLLEVDAQGAVFEARGQGVLDLSARLKPGA